MITIEILKSLKTKIVDWAVQKAMTVVRYGMKADPSWTWSWHCNVAVVAQIHGLSHRNANEAAAEFMWMTFQSDTARFPEYRALQEKWAGA